MNKTENMYSLTKKFRFEAAHRLNKGYEGKCARIHGHSWNGKIAVVTPSLDPFDMGIDFGELKKFTTSIEDKFDHRLILYADDPLHDEIQAITPQSVVTWHNNPTSESLASWIFEFISTQLPKNCMLHYVEIEETCTTSCRFSNIL